MDDQALAPRAPRELCRERRGLRVSSAAVDNYMVAVRRLLLLLLLLLLSRRLFSSVPMHLGHVGTS